jgi:hypothetical protein
MADRTHISNATMYGWNYDEHTFTYAVSGNVTADQSAKLVTFVPVFLNGGRIVSAFLAAGENGADGTDPLSMTGDILINGTSIFSTLPGLAKAAGTGKKTTISAGTGITVGVINTEADNVATGDKITVTLDITRTTPETEMADVAMVFVVRPLAVDPS